MPAWIIPVLDFAKSLLSLFVSIKTYDAGANSQALADLKVEQSNVTSILETKASASAEFDAASGGLPVDAKRRD